MATSIVTYDSAASGGAAAKQILAHAIARRSEDGYLHCQIRRVHAGNTGTAIGSPAEMHHH